MNGFRLDRVATLWIVQPLLRRRKEHGRCLPILMYHSISDAQETGLAYYHTTTSPQVFEEQMHSLSRCGYRGVDLEAGLQSLNDSNPALPRCVAITFDDGFRDFYTVAAPTLRKFNFTATMFLPTAFIGTRRCSFKGRECLTWSEIKELRSQGMRFGSHTVTHPRLHGMPWDEVETELRASKETLEDQLQEGVTSFAYPYAFPQEDTCFAARIADSLRIEGYRAAVTTIIGRAVRRDSSFYLPRLPVNSQDDHDLLRAKLAGAYDWLGKAQLLWRSCRRRSKARNPRLSPAPCSPS